jgi:hypothetical protein
MPNFKISFPLLFNAQYNIELEKTDIEVAWNIFCELQTRVGIIDFNEEEDIISICFESWYSLFKVIREQLKELKVPIKKSKSKESKNLDQILLSLLNDHMRPFLRKWHFNFKSYWEKNYENGKNPIEIQKAFPNYSSLIKDIHIMEKKLKEILNALEKIVRWGNRKFYCQKSWFILKMFLLILIMATIVLLYIKFIFPFLNI